MTAVKISQSVRERLAFLENERGQLTPDMVVHDARAEDSPLHELFDWDMEKAAMGHWLWTARTIINSVKVAVTTEHHTFQAVVYVRDPSMGPKEQGYISIAALRKDPVQARETVRVEFLRAESALSRAREVAIALNLEDEIDELVIRLSGLRERLADQSKGEHNVA